MPNIGEREAEDIKAGVEGVLSDVPEPSGEAVPETTNTEMGETTYSSNSYNNNYPSQQTTELPPQQGIDTERVHAIIEAIINEKWDELVGKIGNLGIWKERVNIELVSIKQELVRVEEDFRQLQNAVLGKVKDYDQGIRDVHTEMKALEKVFEKILDPLTSNIKEMTRLTQDLKKIK